MKVDSQYRTVILQAYPDPFQEKILEKCEDSVLKFLETSRFTLQKMLYHQAKSDFEGSMRTLSLLTRRFTGSLGEKAMIPFDGDNSKFTQNNGCWFVEIQTLKGGGNRITIPIAKTEVPYYDCFQDLSDLPFYLVRENDKWFMYVSIPVSEGSNAVDVGIDFNFKLWVAAPYNGVPLFFDARKYSNTVDRLQKLIARAQSNAENTDSYYNSLRGLIKQAHGNFLSAITDKWDICTLHLENVDVMFKMRGLKSKLTNNWLYKKTAFRQFILRALAKGFNVNEVSPRGTTSTCHRCGHEIKKYGKHERLISCPHCGLRDYNRDLNAARNIAKACCM